MAKTPRSPLKPQETINAAHTVFSAGRPQIDHLKERLGADIFDRIAATKALLEQLVGGRSVPTEAMVTSTRELKTVLAEANATLSAVRSAITNRFPVGHPMRSKFGLRNVLNANSMPATVEALRLFIEGFEQHPAEAAAANLQPKDLAKLKGFLEEIPAANEKQEDSKTKRKNATSLLESTNFELYKMLTWLKIAAELDLAHEPTARDAIVGALTFSKPKNKVKAVAE